MKNNSTSACKISPVIRFIILLVSKVNNSILNSSANMNGITPNCNIGLSQPIKSPNQKIPKI